MPAKTSIFSRGNNSFPRPWVIEALKTRPGNLFVTSDTREIVHFLMRLGPDFHTAYMKAIEGSCNETAMALAIRLLAVNQIFPVANDALGSLGQDRMNCDATNSHDRGPEFSDLPALFQMLRVSPDPLSLAFFLEILVNAQVKVSDDLTPLLTEATLSMLMPDKRSTDQLVTMLTRHRGRGTSDQREETQKQFDGLIRILREYAENPSQGKQEVTRLINESQALRDMQRQYVVEGERFNSGC